MTLSNIINNYNSISNSLDACHESINHCLNLIENYMQESTSQLIYLSFDPNTSYDEKLRLISKASQLTMDNYISIIQGLIPAISSIKFELGKLITTKIDFYLLKSIIQKLNSEMDDAGVCLNSLVGEVIQRNVDFEQFCALKKHFEASLKICYSLVQSTNLLFEAEAQLLEPLPKNIEAQNLILFELQSYKTTLNFSTYAQDLTYLSKFMTQAQQIINPNGSIFVRRIESGSLKITWSGKEIEIACISAVINAIINGLQNFASIPINIRIKKEELKKTKLENEALETQNQSLKLAVINSEIDNLTEKLNLNKNNPEDIEKIQLLCIPLIEYLESNPVGCINHKEYDINNSLKQLITKNNTEV